MISRAQFHIGQIIHHRLFGYRGVIIDVDASFSGSEAWYDQVAISHPPKDRPWYHVLVDGADHTTYVAERNLEDDEGHFPIEHPALNRHFSRWHEGEYLPRRQCN